MTIKEAVSIVQRTLYADVAELVKDNDRDMALVLDTAWKIVREAALRYTCKTENRLSDEGTTTAWMNMPESPNDEDFIETTKTWLCSLDRKTNQCETDISMLWDAVEAIKDKLPKEWGK